MKKPESKERKLILILESPLKSETHLGFHFPRVFSGQKGSIRNNVFDSQLRLLDTLANSDMTKKDAVRKGSLMDALYSMDESVRKHDELEERLQSKRGR